MRQIDDIQNGFALFKKNKAKSIVSVVKSNYISAWANTLPSNLSMEKFLVEENAKIRSHEFKQFYQLNGAFYLAEVESFLDQKSFFLIEKIYALIMNKINSIDIDTDEDFELAEIILKGINV